MNTTTRRALGLASFVAVAALPALAIAADIGRIDDAELAQLSPEVAAQVKARAVAGNTIGGVMETMLLNSMPTSLSAKRIVAIDFRKADVVFERNDGTLKDVPFDTTTLKVKA
jgi:hypothetical protein